MDEEMFEKKYGPSYEIILPFLNSEERKYIPLMIIHIKWLITNFLLNNEYYRTESMWKVQVRPKNRSWKFWLNLFSQECVI